MLADCLFILLTLTYLLHLSTVCLAHAASNGRYAGWYAHLRLTYLLHISTVCLAHAASNGRYAGWYAHLRRSSYEKNFTMVILRFYLDFNYDQTCTTTGLDCTNRKRIKAIKQARSVFGWIWNRTHCITRLRYVPTASPDWDTTTTPLHHQTEIRPLRHCITRLRYDPYATEVHSFVFYNTYDQK